MVPISAQSNILLCTIWKRQSVYRSSHVGLLENLVRSTVTNFDPQKGHSWIRDVRSYLMIPVAPDSDDVTACCNGRCCRNAFPEPGSQVGPSFYHAYPDVFWSYCFAQWTSFIYGHTKQEALHPVRSAKLSCLGPRQYYGGGPHGNPRCRRFSFLPLFLPLARFTSRQKKCWFWGRWVWIFGTMVNFTGLVNAYKTTLMWSNFWLMWSNFLSVIFRDDGLEFSGRWS